MRTKDKEFIHSKISVTDVKFPKVKVDNFEHIMEICDKFNTETDIDVKRKLSYELPEELFCTCRFCGKRIINSKFIVKYYKGKGELYNFVPQIKYRIIDGKQYELSCCEDCLLEHFKSDPPKYPKYYFMKANKYGQYCFGYSDEDYKKICSMTVGVTKESLIRKWGEELGKKKWLEYCNKQAKTNTFEYKKEKFGWSYDDFKEFNKSRAVTKENLIKKYGEQKGIEIFNDYCKKQQITKSFEYMKEKYGEEYAYSVNKSKALTIDNFIKKYGEEEGFKRYNEVINHNIAFYSKVSQKLFDELDKYFQEYKTYYATKNTEYGVMLSNKTYIKLDYYIYELKICIEFNGTNFHADPRFFKETDHPNPFNKTITAKEIWDHDNYRINSLLELGIKTIIVWESDYNKKSFNINELVKKIKG